MSILTGSCSPSTRCWQHSLVALTAVLLIGCESNHGPSRTLSGLSLTIYSAGTEVDRNLVVVGEGANAYIDTWSAEGCYFDAPCPVSADVALRSSQPAVLSLPKQVRAPSTVPLVAHAPGSTTVTASAGGFSKSRRIDVVAEPLPLDAIHVGIVTNWGDPPAEYDESHNLTWLQLSVGQFAALAVGFLRNGTGVLGIVPQISSSDVGVASATTACRPRNVDPNCDVISAIWIQGVGPGDAQVTVFARNVSTTFAVHVVAP